MASARPLDPLHQAAWPNVVESLQEAYAELAQAQGRIERQAMEADETRELFEQVIESMSEALLLVDRKGRLVTVNRAACEMLERDRDDMLGARLAAVWPGEGVPTTAWELLKRSPGGSIASVDMEARPPSGRVLVLQVACDLVRDKRGRISGLLLVARDITQRQREEEGQRLLADVSGILASSLDYRAAFPRMAERVVRGRAQWCAAYQRREDRLERIALAGTSRALPASLSRGATDVEDPVVRALARGRRAQRPGPGSRRARRGADAPSWLVAPLVVGRRSLGMLALGRDAAPVLDAVDAHFVEELARRAAQAIDRARLHHAVEQARGQAEEAASIVQRVQQISDAALAYLDLDSLLPELLARIARALEIHEASVYLPGEDPDRRLVLRARHGPEPAHADRLTALVRQAAPALANTHRPVPLSEGSSGPVPPDSRRGSAASLLAMPLRSGRRLTGVLLVGRPRRQGFCDTDVRLLDLVAGRAALAIENARLYEHERGIAETLQRSLLPERLPRTPGIAIAARYFPGTEGMQIGGDWYDVIELRSGELGVMVGDVVGHGMRAAAEMGQLRTTLRTYLFEGHGPAQAITGLHRLSSALLDNVCATVVCALLEPASGRLRFASAGHPPPLLLGPDGRTTFLEGGRSVLLGIGVDTVHEACEELVLEPGATLLLYTDGLVERRSEVIDEGLARLGAAASSGPEPVDSLLDHLVAEMFPSGERRDDDVALLALRRIERGGSPRLSGKRLRRPLDEAGGPRQ